MSNRAARKVSKANILQMAKDQDAKVSNVTSDPKSLFEFYLQKGFSPAQAGMFTEKALNPVSTQDSTLGIMSATDNTPPMESSMATATKHKANGVGGRRKVLLNGVVPKRELPEGTRLAAVFGRGLRRWRYKLGISGNQAADTYGINRSNWAKVEQAKSPAITGLHCDDICEAIGVSFMDIYKLGLPPA